MKMNIYVDIDGVLLANDHNRARHAEELIAYMVENHDVYWLTTHCRGDAIHTQQHLSRYFTDQPTLRALGKIRPTDWTTWKTEAIDFTQPFFWLDDDVFEAEERDLRQHAVYDSWINIDLAQDEHQLSKVIAMLKALDRSRETSSACPSAS